MIKSKNMQLILASSSQARKKILASLGLKFKTIPSHIDETKISATNPKLLVQKIAKAKAEKVFDEIKNQQRSNVATQQPSYLILAADSMVVLDNQIIGKPKDKKDAKQILKQLSGKTHEFITGLYVINTKSKKVWQKYAETKVTFRKLKDQEINRYIKKTDVTRFAGGYAIVPPQDFNLKTVKKGQSPAPSGAGQSDIITKIDGSFTNVMGLPIETVLPILKENGIDCL